ncbi:MAG: hypothetical protein ABH860_04020 [bacterium]
MAAGTISKYRMHTLKRANLALQRFYGAPNLRNITLETFKRDQLSIRTYPNLSKCDMNAVQRHMIVLRPDLIQPAEIIEAARIKLAGAEIIEDAAAGEATRLKLGTKAMLTPEKMAEAVMLHNIKNPDNSIILPVQPSDLAPISLGIRHKLQYVYDLINLAVSGQHGVKLNPQEVLKSQTTLTILNEETALPFLREALKYRHYGLNPERTLFMVQGGGLGMKFENGELVFDTQSKYQLWNHGNMKIQQTLEGKIFWVRINKQTGEMEKMMVGAGEFREILSKMRNLISYPIEDIDYIEKGSINLNNLAVALRLGKQGYRMIMEGVAQKTDPQKGGFFTYDPEKSRVVCVESDCGGTIINEKDKESLGRIQWLNKNFNNFPEPVNAFDALASKEFPLHLTVKGDAIYPQTPQGDQNFFLRTAFITWEPVQALRSLKVLQECVPTFLAFKQQDERYGFLELAKEYGILPK